MRLKKIQLYNNLIGDDYMSINYVCNKCGKKYDPKTLVFRCDCGGMLDLEKFNFKIY